MSSYSFNTRLLHPNIKNADNATVTPVYQTSAFAHESAESLAKLFANKAAGYCYTRLNNPTVDAFESRITKLENGAASVAVSSGMAAVTNALLNVLQSGDEVVSSPSLYGGTIDLFRDFADYGITVKYAKKNEPSEYERLICDKTKIIFAETIGNPRLDITDIPALSEIAKKNNILLVIDNTVATPCLCSPIKLGADIVVNSTSKYINGSASAIGGIITYSGKFRFDFEKYSVLKPYAKFGPMAYIAKMRATIHQHFGASMAPQTALLNNIGVETLGVRMERACENTKALAEFLNETDGITVNYPGLPNNEYHSLGKQILEGGYGAILTLRVGSKERAFKLINSLEIPLIVSNIGDTKTLVIHPASTIALHSTEEEKEHAGVYDDLIRVSVGIEDINDLKNDFKNAISSLD